MWKTMINKVVLSLLTFMITFFSGCAAVGPDYVASNKKSPTAWHGSLDNKLTDEQVEAQALASWWKTLNDTELSSLIDRALVSNLDVKEAYARIREARASRNVAEAARFPSIDFSGSQTATRGSDDNGSRETVESYSSGFDAGWEVDIFGGVRRSIEAASATYQASEEDLRDVLVTLVSEVALNYVDVRTYQARLAAVRDNIALQSETCQLVDWRSQAGLSDELALQQARYSLESARSKLPSMETGLEEAMNRIAVLIGIPPGGVHDELSQSKPLPNLPLEVAIGVPADMIRRRPDIRRAERQLAAQTAKIGVATADLYPKFTLNGSIGMEALKFNNLADNMFTPSDWILSAGPRVTWNIFDAGAIRGNIEVQSAIQEQKLIQYEAAVLGAIEEVENAIVAYVKEYQTNESLRKAAQAAQKAAELADWEYQSGLTDFSNVLDAQRSLLTFQDQLTESDGVKVSNLIRVYKTLGGGWSSLMNQDEQNID